jgi:2-methylcitrate dehydratase PrpD
VRAARVTVTMRGGQVIEQFAPCRKGDPEAPLTDADLNDKFTELASPVIGAEAARLLLDQLWDMERQDVSALRLRLL